MGRRRVRVRVKRVATKPKTSSGSGMLFGKKLVAIVDKAKEKNG